MIDTSALVAMFENEAPAELLRTALVRDAIRLISTVSVLEATCVLGSRRGPAAVLELGLFMAQFHFSQIAFDGDQLPIAQKAWLFYGRGRHPAKLNFGDCASYALSQARYEPLLFIGNDFSQTDLQIVPWQVPGS